MPNPGLDIEQMQEAVNLFEKHGGNKLRAAKAAGIAHGTFRNRLLKGQAAGLRPTEFKPEVKVHQRERLGRVHAVVMARHDAARFHLRRPRIQVIAHGFVRMVRVDVYEVE